MITKIKNLILSHKLIILILIFASIFRVVGVYPGYPEHGDETPYGSAIVMIYHNNLDPGEYGYPSLIPLIQMVIFKFILIPIYWAKFYILNFSKLLDGSIKFPFAKDQAEYAMYLYKYVTGVREINVMYWGRYITAFFGVGVVFLTFILGKRFFGMWTALAGSFFVAVNFREVLNSHIGLPDIYNAFFLLLAMVSISALINKPSKKNYCLVGFANALYFSTKFQVFTIFPFLMVHFYIVWKKSRGFGVKKFLKNLFCAEFITSLLLIPIITLVLNPYHLFHLDKTLSIRSYQLLKYKVGTYALDVYALSYLYRIALGEILSWGVILGFILSLWRAPFKALVLLSVVAQFMFTFIYYSKGGFYTRNFVTIIPILLIFAGINLEIIRVLIQKYLRVSRTFLSIVLILLVFIFSWTNIQKSFIITREYSKPLNLSILIDWLAKNTKASDKISAIITIPLPIPDSQRFTYDTNHSFSLDEFREEGNSDWAISNFAWATNDFYWWMTRGSDESIKHYWRKPVDILEYSYTAIALRELEPYVVVPIFNSWLAPDTEFFVVRVPKFNIEEKTLIHSYSFKEDPSEWSINGNFWTNPTNLIWDSGNLVVKNGPDNLSSVRWQSPIIDVSNWNGFVIDFKTRSDSLLPSVKAGFIYTTFYQTQEDAKIAKNRVGVRVSSRTSTPNIWLDKSLVGVIPKGASFMTVGFYSFDPASSVSFLSDLAVFKAQIDVDLGGVKTTPIHFDENNLFPNSHGNL